MILVNMTPKATVAHDDQVDAMTQALLRWNMVPYQPAVSYRELPEISPI